MHNSLDINMSKVPQRFVSGKKFRGKCKMAARHYKSTYKSQVYTISNYFIMKLTNYMPTNIKHR